MANCAGKWQITGTRIPSAGLIRSCITIALRSVESLSIGQVKSESDRERQYASVLRKRVRSGCLWEAVREPLASETRQRGFFFFNLVKLTTFSQALISASLMGQRPTCESAGERSERKRNGSGDTQSL